LSVTNVFGYHPRSEVTEALMGDNAYGYAYDPLGNRMCSRQWRSAVGGLLSVTTTDADSGTSTNFYRVYDANGNVTAYLDAGGSAVAAFEYDAFGNNNQRERSGGATSAVPVFDEVLGCGDWAVVLRLPVLYAEIGAMSQSRSC